MKKVEKHSLSTQYDIESSSTSMSTGISKSSMDNEYQSLIDSREFYNKTKSRMIFYERSSECGILLLKWCCKISFVKNINVKHGVLALLVLSLVTIFYYTHYVDNGVFVG